MEDIKKYLKILNENEFLDSPPAESGWEDQDTNKDMLKRTLIQVKNNVLDLESFVESVDDVEPWVLSKMVAASENIETLFNYLKVEAMNKTNAVDTVYSDAGMYEAHPNSKIYDKCWDGYKKVPGKKRGEPGSCEKKS
jgi:hypothetical protein